MIRIENYCEEGCFVIDGYFYGREYIKGLFSSSFKDRYILEQLYAQLLGWA